MSEYSVELADWPAHAIACAANMEVASAKALSQPSSDVRDMIVELSGKGPDTVPKLARFLMRKLGLPDLRTLELDTFVPAITHRLDVITKAERRLTLVLSDGELLSAEQWDFLTALVEKTSLRLLVIGEPEQINDCKTHAHAARLDWQLLVDNPDGKQESSAQPEPLEPKNPQQPKPLSPVSTEKSPLIIPEASERRALLEPEKGPIALKLWLLSAAATIGIGSALLWIFTADSEQSPQTVTTAASKPARSNQLPITADAKTTLRDVRSPFPVGTLYTVQVASYRRADYRDNFLQSVGSALPELRSVDVVRASGRNKMLLVYGAFKDYAEAKTAADNLPVELQLGTPYVITVHEAMVWPGKR